MKNKIKQRINSSKHSRDRLEKPKSHSLIKYTEDINASNPNVKQLRKVISLKRSSIPSTAYARTRKDMNSLS